VPPVGDPDPVRAAERSVEALREPALVLAAAGIDHRIERGTDGWRLVVAPEDADRAGAALEAYDRERSPMPPDGAAESGRSHAGLLVAALLVLFYVVTGPAAPGGRWWAGSASAERVLDGEPWRAVTALTLHADPAHLFANSISAAVFVTAVARVLGPGLGVMLVLAAGAAGNVLNAYVHGAHHTSIGASTAVFGAIGVLGGLQFRRRRGRRGAWLALAGALALLAMLGTGERSDVLAHLFGLVSGLPLGMAAAPLHAPPGPWAQRALVVGTLIAVAAAWLAALGFLHGGRA
jgi:rhomboid protease GluP